MGKKLALDKQEYEVNYNSDALFSIPKTRKEKIQALKVFVRRECEKSWKMSPSPVATLKRRYLDELILSLNS